MERKPKWGKPKLIVLVRGDRQERVLTGCKYVSITVVEQASTENNC